MGAVYRAEGRGLGRTVALKVLAPELAGNERFRERFLRESRLAASLDHPHIVPIFQAGEADGVALPRDALRRGHGPRAAHRATKGALDPDRAVALARAGREALDAAHEQGLVHRDVKPRNILDRRSPAGRALLSRRLRPDQAHRLAQRRHRDRPGRRHARLRRARADHRARRSTRARTSTRSACVLYECLTGQPPFPRATDVAVLWAHVHEEPPPPSAGPARAAAGGRRACSPARLAKEPGRSLRRLRRAGGRGALCARPRRGSTGAGRASASQWRSSARWRSRSARRARSARSSLRRATRAAAHVVVPNSVAVIDPATNELVAEMPVGVDPERGRRRRNAVWAANIEDETVSRIDPATRRLVGGRSPSTATRPTRPSAPATVWVALGALAELVRINPEQNVAAQPVSALGGAARAAARRRASPSAAASSGFCASIADSAASIRAPARAGRSATTPGLLSRRARCARASPTSSSGSTGCGSSNRAANADHRARSSEPQARPITVGPGAGGDRGRERLALGRQLRRRHGLADRHPRARTAPHAHAHPRRRRPGGRRRRRGRRLGRQLARRHASRASTRRRTRS